MSNQIDVQKTSPDDEYIEDILAQFGGVEALRQGADDFSKAVTRMWNDRVSLLEEYPDKWVAVSKDGVVSVGDSIEEVLLTVEAIGIGKSEIVVEFLDTNPATLIL